MPDVWGEGQLFAFSGMEGPTQTWGDLVGSALAGRRGFWIHTAKHIWSGHGYRLSAGAAPGDGPPMFDTSAMAAVRDDIVVGDLCRSVLTPREGCSAAVTFLPLSGDAWGVEFSPAGTSQAGTVALEFSVNLEEAEVTADGFIASRTPFESVSVVGPEGADCRMTGEKTAVISSPFRGESVRFVVCMGPYDPRRLADAGRFMIGKNWGRLFEGRIDWLRSIPLPSPDMPHDVARTYLRACAMLRTNACSPEGYISTPWTTPDRWPHRHCYLWDSAFQSIGYIRFDPVWGRNAVRAMLAGAEGSGMVPSMLTPMGPGKPQTNSPCLAWAAWECYRLGAGREFLDEVYPHLAAYVRHNLTHASEEVGGLLVWPHFSHGMDNSQRFDEGEPLVFLDLNLHEAGELRTMARMARALGRDDEADEWTRLRDKLAGAINERLWDEKTGFYYDLNEDGSLRKVKTATAFVALFAGVADKRRADALAGHLFNPDEFWSPLPIRTTSADEPKYSKDMWRGPVWPNYEVMIVRALDEYGRRDRADYVARRFIEEAVRWYEQTGSIFEYYDAEAEEPPTLLPRKSGRGALCDYGFGLSCVVDFAWRLYGPKAELGT